MLKSLILATLAAALVTATALPIQITPAAAEMMMTCREAAKAKFGEDRKARRAYRKECRAESKASQ